MPKKTLGQLEIEKALKSAGEKIRRELLVLAGSGVSELGYRYKEDGYTVHLTIEAI